MDKPIIEDRGLKLVAFEERHILPFAMDLSAENVREFESLYKISPIEALESIVGDPLVFAVEKDGQPVALTGINIGINDALIWVLFSNQLRKSWISFARASRKLISFYHGFQPNLRAEVWTENEMIHQWLLHLGFEATSIVELDNGQSVVRFVRCNSNEKHVENNSSRPVLH